MGKMNFAERPIQIDAVTPTLRVADSERTD